MLIRSIPEQNAAILWKTSTLTFHLSIAILYIVVRLVQSSSRLGIHTVSGDIKTGHRASLSLAHGTRAKLLAARMTSTVCLLETYY